MSNYLVFIAGALSGAAVLALAWPSHTERAGRAALAAKLAALEQELANLKRVLQNRLYRERLEDVGFAASQAALHVHALRAHIEDELALVESILSRKDAPK